MSEFNAADWGTFLRDILPFGIIALLILRGSRGLRERESEDVWTLRKIKKGK